RKSLPKDDGSPDSRSSLTGCGTALVTPFTESGALDEPALREFVDWQIEQGVHFLVPCGSTGEAATMTLDEHRRVVAITVEQANGRLPIVAGGASNEKEKALGPPEGIETVG